MTREPEEEEAAGAAALARGGRGSLGRIQARRPPLWLLCLAVGWLLGAGADAEFSILDEAQVLASQMRRLAAEELGVVTMQNIKEWAQDLEVILNLSLEVHIEPENAGHFSSAYNYEFFKRS